MEQKWICSPRQLNISQNEEKKRGKNEKQKEKEISIMKFERSYPCGLFQYWFSCGGSTAMEESWPWHSWLESLGWLVSDSDKHLAGGLKQSSIFCWTENFSGFPEIGNWANPSLESPLHGSGGLWKSKWATVRSMGFVSVSASGIYVDLQWKKKKKKNKTRRSNIEWTLREIYFWKRGH